MKKSATDFVAKKKMVDGPLGRIGVHVIVIMSRDLELGTGPELVPIQLLVVMAGLKKAWK